MLALQTKFQLQQYEKYAATVLCIDSTHGTNAYKFKLITVMVADEFGHGEHYCWLNFLIVSVFYRTANCMVHI